MEISIRSNSPDRICELIEFARNNAIDAETPQGEIIGEYPIYDILQYMKHEDSTNVNFEVPETGEKINICNRFRKSNIFARDNFTCKMCGDKAKRLILIKNKSGGLNDAIFVLLTDHSIITVDHIIPSSKGGRNDYSNLQTLCQMCNSKKGNTLPANLHYTSWKVIHQVYKTNKNLILSHCKNKNNLYKFTCSFVKKEVKTSLFIPKGEIVHYVDSIQVSRKGKTKNRIVVIDDRQRLISMPKDCLDVYYEN